MSKNKMEEVAKIIDVKIGEEFWLFDRKQGNERIRCKYKLTDRGLERKYYFKGAAWASSDSLEDILTGKYEVVKINPISILDDIEKKYLGNIIKPFRDRVEWVRKFNSPNNKKLEYIKISYSDCTYSNVLNFPDFKRGTMYRGMKIGKSYTLKELGL